MPPGASRRQARPRRPLPSSCHPHWTGGRAISRRPPATTRRPPRLRRRRRRCRSAAANADWTGTPGTAGRVAGVPPRSCVHAAASRPTANTGLRMVIAYAPTIGHVEHQLEQDVIREQQQNPRQALPAEQRIRLREPRHAVPRIVAREDEFPRIVVHRSAFRKARGPFHTVAQDALEVFRIMRVHQFPGARQVQVVQPGKPEAQSRRAQQRRPRGALVGGQRPDGVVGGDQRLRAFGVDGLASGVVDAPVVDGDGEVIGVKVRRGKSEVDDSRDAPVMKQNVVAEEVAVDGALGQLAAAEARLELEFGVEQS